MAEKETKRIDVLDGTADRDRHAKERITEFWRDGWDLESITGYTEGITMYGYTTSRIQNAKLIFVRDLSIPIIAELAKLENEYYNPSNVPSNPGEAPVKPTEPVKGKFGVGWIILSAVALASLLIGIVGNKILFITAGAIGLVIVIGRILSILSYKAVYKVYMEKDKAYKAYMEKDTAYREKLSEIERNRTKIRERMESLRSDDLRQSALRKSLSAWENRPKR
jgi:hypothetical protein